MKYSLLAGKLFPPPPAVPVLEGFDPLETGTPAEAGTTTVDP
jgi:hypothetical protein